MEREIAWAGAPVPTCIATVLAGYEWTRNAVGESGAIVYRLHGKAQAPDLFLKHATGAVADDIIAEMDRLRWLARYLPVPEVLQCVVTPDGAWLLTTALAGESAYQVLQASPESRIAVVDALAKFLRRLHAIPVSACPYASHHVYRLAAARARIDAGVVDEDDFDEEREGWTAE